MSPRTSWRALLLAALSVCALVMVGCAGLRCPRIDPSGERLFIWPRDQVPAAVPASANLRAQPVFTDPVFPQPVLPVQALGVAGQPVAGLIPPLPQDRLTLTPGRVLAPVGSEVILKAGLCTRDNYLLTDSKVDWLLARDEVGEFVSLGGRGWCKNPLLPWNKPKKIDNQYAIGYTAKVPLLITRGTADPSDDVQVEPGEAWASITSPVEGTSRITAVAPEIETWANRRATATIYWVDVQWTFPPPAITAGGSQVLTTTVLRQTDGTPIEGWLVRYEVADGAGTLRGSESGQVVEVPTDANGRASIDVTPTGSAGTTTRINTQIVRPVRFAGSNAPRLVVANGASAINWTDGGSDYLPPPDDLGNVLPPNPFPGGGASPPIQPTPAPRQGPKLQLSVFPEQNQVPVGGQARFEVEIVNTGDSPATGIRLSDNYDAGFAHLRDPDRLLRLEKSIRDISASGTYSEFLTFDVNQAGQLCQEFSVTYNGGSTLPVRKCIQGIQPQRQPQGRLEVKKQGPRLQNVGEVALFTLSIKNVGEAPLTNIEVVDTYDRELQPQPPQGAEIVDGSLRWRIPRLEVGQVWRQDINCQCMGPKLESRSTVSVSAETGAGVVSLSDFSRTEIRPAAGDVMPPVAPAPEGGVFPGVNPPAAGGAAANPNVAGNLRMELTMLSANPVLVGTRPRFQIVISNSAAISDRNVQLRVAFPQELTPDVAAITNTARVAAQFNNNRELVFEPINELRNNAERLEFMIPCNVNQQGVREVIAFLNSQNMPQGIQQNKRVEITVR